MIFKSRKTKEIERLNKLVDTLTKNDIKVNKICEDFKNKNKTLINEKQIIAKERDTLANKVLELSKKLEVSESRRRKNAAALGGCKKAMNEAIKIKKELLDVQRKREQDYLFALRVIFRETKMTVDTKAFLGQRKKELQQKYSKEKAVVVNVGSKSKQVKTS